MAEGTLKPTGTLTVQVIRGKPKKPAGLLAFLRRCVPWL